MARAAERTRVDGGQSQVAMPAGRLESTCARCGGLMVSDLSMDLLSSTGELEFAATRCVQCGEVVDPVIERNRQLRQDMLTVRCVPTPIARNIEAKGQY